MLNKLSFHQWMYCISILLMTLSVSEATEVRQGPIKSGRYGTISGRILVYGGRILSEGRIAFFSAESDIPPRIGTMRRIPDQVTELDRDGRFSVTLPSGRYYLGVITKEENAALSPPNSMAKGYAAVDRKGARKIFTVPERNSTVDFGDISVASITPTDAAAGLFTVRGTVKDNGGHPFAGAWILVRRDPDIKRPFFISGKTDKEGRFELKIPAGGPYFLIARDVLTSGRPEPGLHVGAYSGDNPILNQIKPEPRPIPISGRPGDILEGINILMVEVPEGDLPDAGIEQAVPR
jgi:hypothetical protein